MIFPDIWLSYLSKKTLKQQQKFNNLVIYSSAIAVSLVLATIRIALFFLVALRASQRLHDKMVKAVLHAKLLFFDTNPTGRILNRFSRDIGCIDEQLPQYSIICIQYLFFVLSGALIPAFANPWLLLVLFPILLTFGLFTRYYLKTSRELKRLESICRSPVFSHFSETMAGLDTIRTSGMEEEFMEEFYRFAMKMFHDIKLIQFPFHWLLKSALPSERSPSPKKIEIIGKDGIIHTKCIKECTGFHYTCFMRLNLL